MNRKGIALVMMTFLLAVAGCTSKEYESNLELGKEQAQAENYLQAYEAFSTAYKEKNTTEANELKELSKLLSDGIRQYKQKNYEGALAFFKKAAGYDANTKEGKRLVSAANEWVTKVDNVQPDTLPAKEGQLGPDDPATQVEGNMEGSKGTQKSEPKQTPSVSIKSNKNTVDTSKITVNDAEQLVKDFIKIKDYPQLSVQYDHKDEKGNYIFQVFESVQDGQGGHTATWGWYGVNPKTKEVYDIM